MNDIVKTIEENYVLLDSIAKSVFGIKPEQARRKAALGTLAVPAFRINGARKGPLYVLRADVDRLLKERYETAARLTRQMASVT